MGGESQRIEALLFDLGGVVFRVDFANAFSRWAHYSGSPPEIIQARFSFDSHYERHERAEISARDYFESLRESLRIDLSDDQLEEGWNAIFEEEFPGMAKLLRRLRARVPIYVFSNSNHTHRKLWQAKYASTIDLFEEIFVSCDIGLRKPEAAAFRHVADAMGTDPERILFFDDSEENVRGARRIGIPAVHVRGFTDVPDSVAEFLDGPD